MTPDTDGLADALVPAFGDPVTISELRRLTGGASRETWAFTANGEELILRRDPPGRPGAPGAMRREADIMRACAAAGLSVPRVILHDDGDLLGTAGLVMTRVPGETLPRRILRDDRFADARRVLVAELAVFLAGLHAIDHSAVPGVGAPDALAAIWERYHHVDDRSPTFEKVHGWLLDNRPERSPDVLVHGDLRVGNIIVGADGLQAVIDWELIHLGDPLEDLAWLCLKAWRFGEDLEVGGLGTLDQLIGAYTAAGGRPVDRAALHWWIVLKTLTWGVGCMLQAHIHLTGAVRSVDLAAVGRKSAEQEWDLLELVAPEASRAALAAPVPAPLADRPDDYGRPTARELLESVREFLTERVVPSDDSGLAYQARVAANTLAIVERELATPATRRSGDGWPELALAVRDRLSVSSPRHLDRARAALR